MIQYQVKNLIQAAKEGQVEAIGHCSNCFCTMGSGIAPQIVNAFPSAATEDKKTIPGDKDKLGTMSFGVEGKLHIYNLYGQYGYGRKMKGHPHINYSALRSALLLMSKHMDQEGKTSVGLPKLGAGLAGGEWSVIEKIIEETLVDRGFDVVIYVLSEDEIPTRS